MRTLLLTRDILITVVGFLAENKDTFAMVQVCKPMKTILYNHGYIKHLEVFPNSLFKTIKNYDKHKRTLLSLSLHHIDNIQYYFCWFPRSVTLHSCTLLQDEPTPNTELVIIN